MLKAATITKLWKFITQPLQQSTYPIIELYDIPNGGSSPQFRALAGSLPSAGVFVIVIDHQDPTGTGQDTIVFDELRLKADTFLSGTYPGPMFFNGNDAVSLEKNRWNFSGFNG
jgi:predicted dienelactone hydrolase